MSEENVVYAHELLIRFEQLEDGTIHWYLMPDEATWRTKNMSLIDMAEGDAPLSAMSIRALWKLCADGTVLSSLSLAKSIKTEVGKRLISGPVESLALESLQDVTIN